VLALTGTATWWFASGRWTSVPGVDGQDSAAAEKALTDADLNPHVTRARHNEIQSGKVIRTDPAGGARALRGDQITLIVSMGRPTVPAVAAGISVEEAEAAIRAEELQPLRDDGANEYHDTVPKGAVIGLKPQGGTQLSLGETVTIVVSKGVEPKPVPDVHGKTRDEAFQALREAGFEPFDAPGEFSADVEGGRVIRTDPSANTRIEDGKSRRVGVVASTAVTVPDLSRQSVPDAQRILAEANLKLELQPFANPNGRVWSQQPGPGGRVEPGSTVAVFAL
jgi:beta-lactam-binding protein with PASTA domain